MRTKSIVALVIVLVIVGIAILIAWLVHRHLKVKQSGGGRLKGGLDIKDREMKVLQFLYETVNFKFFCSYDENNKLTSELIQRYNFEGFMKQFYEVDKTYNYYIGGIYYKILQKILSSMT